LTPALDYAAAKLGVRPQDFKRVLVAAREPVSRELSMYAYFQILAESPSVEADLNDAAMLAWVRRAAREDPDAYMAALEREIGHCDVWRSRLFYRTAEGRRPENLRILRFERLEEDLREALSGVDRIAEADLLHLNHSNSNRIRFNDASEAFIARSYAWMRELEI